MNWRLLNFLNIKAKLRPCVLLKTRTGVAKINERFHRRFARFVQRDADFLVGEPVMMLHNDYDRMLFNGDQGIVLWGQWNDSHARPLIIFPSMDGGFRAFEMEALAGRIELCFAMTAHKSQGSEFERISLLAISAFTIIKSGTSIQQ